MNDQENVRLNPSSNETGWNPNFLRALSIANPVFAGLLAGWEKSAAVTFLMSDLFNPK